MAGPDLDLVAEAEQAPVQRAVHVGGALTRLDREVGPGDVADEQRVAAEQRPGGVVAAGVAQQEGGVLGPVPRRVDRLDRHLAEVEDPAVGERLVRILGLGQLMDVDRRAGGAGEAPMSGDVVGVVVGLQHVLDPHPVQPRQAAVGIDVPLRIDHRRVPRIAIGDQIGGAAEVLVDDLAEEHDRPLQASAVRARRPVHAPFTPRRAPARLNSRPRAAVAQLARASACHAEGRGFESLQPLFRESPARGRVGFGLGRRNKIEPSPHIAVIPGTNAH